MKDGPLPSVFEPRDFSNPAVKEVPTSMQGTRPAGHVLLGDHFVHRSSRRVADLRGEANPHHAKGLKRPGGLRAVTTTCGDLCG